MLLHVVDDDQPEHLVEIEGREAEQILAEQVSAMAELRGADCHWMAAPGDAFDGILRMAASFDANLIVMGAHRKQLLRDIFVGTTVERVIRTGPYPVLMVNNEVKRPYQSAVAAVDMSAPSAHAIKAAKRVSLVDGADITALHAFLPLAKGKMSTVGIDRTTIDEYVAGERQKAIDQLIEFLSANSLSELAMRVGEGEAFEVIACAVEEMRPDLLVIGTHGRSGLARVLLGSVTEEALRRLDVDILAVPPVRA
jgi:nucleotide-binding universal stress UspA family protein